MLDAPTTVLTLLFFSGRGSPGNSCFELTIFIFSASKSLLPAQKSCTYFAIADEDYTDISACTQQHHLGAPAQPRPTSKLCLHTPWRMNTDHTLRCRQPTSRLPNLTTTTSSIPLTTLHTREKQRNILITTADAYGLAYQDDYASDATSGHSLRSGRAIRRNHSQTPSKICTLASVHTCGRSEKSARPTAAASSLHW